MQIHFRAGGFHFERSHSAQSITQGRRARRNHSGVRNHDHVALERVAVVGQKFPEVLAADFLFALDDKIDIHRQIAVFLERFLNADDVRKNLSLLSVAPRANT